MPFITANDCRAYYRIDGADAAPALMLSHSLGLDHAMWDEQVSDLLPRFRVVRYDTRGHGASGVTRGDYTVEQLGRDALGIADALGIQRFAFCGLSLGGFIGQWLALHAPNRVTHLVLANTSARLSEPKDMETRRRTVLAEGMPAIADASMQRFFSPGVLQANPPRVAWARRTLLATDPVGYAGCCAALRDFDNTSRLNEIATPTLVIGGDRDVPMPWPEHSEPLVQKIAGATGVCLPAGHISNLERPRSFSAALATFLMPRATPSREEGLKVRRAVLGDAHVDQATAATTAFTRDFQDLITRYAWGGIWTRPGLDHRTRRLLVLAVTAAMGRWEEFRLHVRTGLEHELEACDLQELLLQLAVYAGVPTANTGFQHAAEELTSRPQAGG